MGSLESVEIRLADKPLSAEAICAMYNAVCCSKPFALCLRPRNLDRPVETSAPLRRFGVPAGPP